MGRRKIKIERITDPRQRVITLTKRKRGLIKKAMELSLLTGAQVVLQIFDEAENYYVKYASEEADLPWEQLQETA